MKAMDTAQKYQGSNSELLLVGTLALISIVALALGLRSGRGNKKTVLNGKGLPRFEEQAAPIK